MYGTCSPMFIIVLLLFFTIETFQYVEYIDTAKPNVK